MFPVLPASGSPPSLFGSQCLRYLTILLHLLYAIQRLLQKIFGSQCRNTQTILFKGNIAFTESYSRLSKDVKTLEGWVAAVGETVVASVRYNDMVEQGYVERIQSFFEIACKPDIGIARMWIA